MKINFSGDDAHTFLSMPSSIVVGEAGVDQDEGSGSLY